MTRDDILSRLRDAQNSLAAGRRALTDPILTPAERMHHAMRHMENGFASMLELVQALLEERGRTS